MHHLEYMKEICEKFLDIMTDMGEELHHFLNILYQRVRESTTTLQCFRIEELLLDYWRIVAPINTSGITYAVGVLLP